MSPLRLGSRALCHPHPPWRIRENFCSCTRPAPPLLRRSSHFCPANIAELWRWTPLSANVASSTSATLTVRGYVRSVRKQRRVAFAVIGDGSTLQTLQAVLTPQLAEGLSTGAAVQVSGKWIPSLGQEQSHELQVERAIVLGGNSASTYPIQKKYQTPEFLRTVPHLRARLPFNALLLRLRSLVISQITAHFAKHDFVQCHPPVITSSDCEGAGDVFSVAPALPSTFASKARQAQEEDDFFGSPKYLTVSSQLHLEALAQSVNKAWALAPTFRAERSDTARHLSEFYMLEAEVAFSESLEDIMLIVEHVVRGIAASLRESMIGRELLEIRAKSHEGDSTFLSRDALAQRWEGLIAGPWPQITHHDAVVRLQDAMSQGQAEFNVKPRHEHGLRTEHERFLASSVGRNGPVFVTNYPRTIKPFYMAPSGGSRDRDGAPPTVACFDLLVPDICELAGGSLREHRLSALVESMNEHGLQQGTDVGSDVPNGSLEWYADLRRFGSVPHGGFGLGFDRLLCYLSGVSNIKDVVSFPRWYQRCDC